MTRIRLRATFGFWLLAFGFLTSCAHPVFNLPSGPGTAAPDAAGAWSEATAACRDVHTFSAELRLSGRAGASGKIKGTALAGLTDAGQIRMEVPAPFGRPIFVLAGSSSRATFVSRDNGTLTAPAPAILEALVGLSLQPQSLLALLSGCGVRQQPAGEPLKHDDVVAVGSPGGRVFLKATEGRWRVVAAELPGWLVDYQLGGADPWPTALHIRSTDHRNPPISLSIAEHQVETNTSIPNSAFTIAVPPGATPLTLADLRAAGPLGERR